jgi:hypothetical protein
MGVRICAIAVRYQVYSDIDHAEPHDIHQLT